MALIHALRFYIRAIMSKSDAFREKFWPFDTPVVLESLYLGDPTSLAIWRLEDGRIVRDQIDTGDILAWVSTDGAHYVSDADYDDGIGGFHGE